MAMSPVSRIPLLLSAWLLAGFSALSVPAAAQEISLSAASRQALGVQTAKAQSAGSSGILEATGLVTAPPDGMKTTISPLSGVVAETLAAPGDVLSAGATIAYVVSAEYPQEEAALRSARLAAAHMGEILERARKLQSIGMMSEAEVDEARHDARDARLLYEGLSERFRDVGPSPTAGQFALKTRAAGTLSDLRVRSGEAIEAGMPLASVMTGDRLWARAKLSASSADSIQAGAEVTAGDVPGRGQIVSVAPTIDPETRTREVFVRLPADYRPRIGSFVPLRIEGETPDGALRVPLAAVSRLDGGYVVFKEEGEGFMPTPVDIVSRFGSFAVVMGALSPGDAVVTSGVAALKNLASGS